MNTVSDMPRPYNKASFTPARPDECVMFQEEILELYRVGFEGEDLRHWAAVATAVYRGWWGRKSQPKRGNNG